MTAKEHYEYHLGNFYSWMAGDFTEKQHEQQNFFTAHSILPRLNMIAFDLGAGHGLQSVSLANLGFSVTAIDFNTQLLNALAHNSQKLSVKIVQDELVSFLEKTSEQAELILCMGDTLTHLDSLKKVAKLFRLMVKRLMPGGKVVLSFRDLTHELKEEQRFIPVKSDQTRIHTCFLEYFPDRVIVHDILYENRDGKWIQKVSAYPKLRLNESRVAELLEAANLKLVSSEVINRMIYLIAKKVN